MFRKYNTNHGTVDLTEDAELCNTFSHWTWVRTEREPRGQVMVLDMQGVELENGTFECTDPQVQHQDRLRFGKGNFGIDGFSRFFAGHICSRYCRELGLRRPGEMNEQVAKSIATAPPFEASPLNAASIPLAVPVPPPPLVDDPMPLIEEERTRPTASDGSVFRVNQSVGKPQWQADNEVYQCPLCKSELGWLNLRRRHHCRMCGQVVCSSCSKNRMRLPFEMDRLSRICNHCVIRIQGGSPPALRR